MNERIIYPKQDGGICVVIPAQCGLTIQDIALKDIPAGLPYKIIDVSQLPADREFRNAWEADFSNPDGYGLGYDGWIAWKAEQENE